MADQGGEFSLFQGIHVRTGFDSNETNQADVAEVNMSRSRDKLKILYLQYHSAYGHHTWPDGELP